MLEKEVINIEMGKAKAFEINAEFSETSAMECLGIFELFQSVANQLYELNKKSQINSSGLINSKKVL